MKNRAALPNRVRCVGTLRGCLHDPALPRDVSRDDFDVLKYNSRCTIEQ
jgi:hypothetical protein